MNAAVGLLFGLGLFCIWWSFWPKPEAAAQLSRSWPFLDRLSDDLAHAEIAGATVKRALLSAGGIGLLVALALMAMTGVPAFAAAFGTIAGYAPLALIRARARRRRTALREIWPDVVDHLASAVRAGLALPEALCQLGVRGPAELRGYFGEFAHHYRATGNFNQCLDSLKSRLADPVGDRLIESLRIAREVGGTDLGRLLRTLSGFLREDSRTRSELEARQSWTVNAARLAVAAPWIVLATLATRGDSLDAYRRPAGVLILVFGAAMSVLAYRIMRRIGRLPTEARVMR